MRVTDVDRQGVSGFVTLSALGPDRALPTAVLCLVGVQQPHWPPPAGPNSTSAGVTPKSPSALRWDRPPPVENNSQRPDGTLKRLIPLHRKCPRQAGLCVGPRNRVCNDSTCHGNSLGGSAPQVTGVLSSYGPWDPHRLQQHRGLRRHLNTDLGYS